MQSYAGFAPPENSPLLRRIFDCSFRTTIQQFYTAKGLQSRVKDKIFGWNMGENITIYLNLKRNSMAYHNM